MQLRRRLRHARQALEAIIELGCSRVLTSGGRASAYEGAPVIAALVRQAGERVTSSRAAIDVAVIMGASVLEKRYGRERCRSSATISFDNRGFRADHV